MALWVPPLRLLSAFLWQVTEQHLVKYYTRLEEFVSVVLEIVPDLLSEEERAELLLGLRAKFILELCHDQPSVTLQIMQPHLERVAIIAESASTNESGNQTVEAGRNFVNLIKTLLQNPTYRNFFFQDIYQLHYGARYDKALQLLVWEFLSRLEKFIPVPSFKEAASWLDEDNSALEDALQMIYDTKKIENLLLYLKHSTHMDPGFSSSNILTNTILSTLSVCFTAKIVLSRCGQADECLSTQYDTQCSANERDRNGDMSEVSRWDLDEEKGNEDGDEEDRHGDVDDHSPQKDTSDQVKQKSEVEGYLSRHENDMSNRSGQEVPTSAGETPGPSPSGDGLLKMGSQSVNTVGDTQCKRNSARHQTIHKGNHPHTCSYCDKTFNCLSHLKEHTRVHAGERTYGCTVCRMRFVRHSHLEKHTQLHTGERPHGCSYCGKAFKTSSHLKDHIRVHTGERPYGCSVCGKRFIQHSNLVVHERKHTSENLECGSDGEVSSSGNKARVSPPQGSRSLKEESELVNDTAEESTYQLEQHACTERGEAFSKATLTTLQNIDAEEMKASQESEVDAKLMSHQPNYRFASQAPQHTCSECGKVLIYKKCLIKHQANHPSQKPCLCSYCGQAFKKEDHLKDHIHIHTGEPPYACSVCGERFTDHGKRIAHKRLHTSEDPESRSKEEVVRFSRNETAVCPPQANLFKEESQVVKTDDSASQPNHIAGSQELQYTCSESGKDFSCSYCGKSFKKKGHLKDHIRIHTGEQPYACPVCGERFTYRAKRFVHMRSHTNEDPESRSKEEVLRSSRNEARVSPPQTSLLEEESQLANTADDSAQQPNNIAGSQEPQYICSESDFSCSYCGKTFKQKGHLKDHIRIHTGEQPYACSVCGKRFVQRSRLVIHNRLHTGEKPHLCTYCGKAFRQRGVLQSHIRVHTGERPYSCLMCGKRFIQSSNLIAHKRQHTGERPYLCSVCGKGFPVKGALSVHMRIHTGELPYKCEFCGKGFRVSSHVVEHRRSHTREKPYNCSACEKWFRSHSALSYHMRTHTGGEPHERPHGFSYCGKAFKNTSYLKDHIGVHTGKRPYSSSVCGKRFIQHSNLVVHERKHTSENLEGMSNGKVSSGNKARVSPPHVSLFEEESLLFTRADDSEHQPNNIAGSQEPQYTCSESGKDFSCSYCGKAFKKKAQLKDHIRIHTGEQPYACSVCGERFTYRWKRIAHERLHTGEDLKSRSKEKVARSSRNEERFSSPQISLFKEESQLVKTVDDTASQPNHIAGSQEPQYTCPESGKDFSCSYCGKSFKKKAQLKDHIRIHTGEQPYACSVCGERFTYRWKRIAHMRSHTSEDPESKSKEEGTRSSGNEAKVSSAQGSLLKEDSQLVNKADDSAHQPNNIAGCQEPQYTCPESGKDFSCSYCGKAFKTFSHLKDHIRVHTGERPYGCSVCGKRFIQHSNLVVHERKHTSENLECGSDREVSSSGNKARVSPPQGSRSLKEESELVNDTAEESTYQLEQHACTERGEAFSKATLTTLQNIDAEEKASQESEVDAKLMSHQPNYRFASQAPQHTCSECGKVFIYKKCLIKHQANHPSQKPWLCSYCGQAFKKEDHLKDHIHIHTGEQPYACSVCGERFTDHGKRIAHERLHTIEDPESRSKEEVVRFSRNETAVCPPQANLFKEESQVVNTDGSASQPNHIAGSQEPQYTCSESGKDFSCSYCGKSFKKKGHLKDHIRIHTGEQPYACPVCGERFTYRAKRFVHMRSHTNEDPESRSKEEVLRSSRNEARVSPPQTSLLEEESQLANTADDSAQQPNNIAGSQEPQYTRSESDFSCSYCGKTFKQKGHLKDHIRIHTGEKPYACSVCGKRFAQRSRLVIHNRLHTGEKPHLCTYCGKAFRQAGALQSHIRVHTGEKPYSCSVCGKRFIQHSGLITHKRLHTGERPYLCSVCGKGFPVKGALSVHMRIHTGELPHKCEFCGKGFRVSCYLAVHRRVHTREKPYNCSVCEKRFSSHSTLGRHMRTHTGEKSHECLQCGKKISNRYNMRVHQRVHR